MKIPRVLSVSLESFIEWRTSSVFVEKKFSLSKGRSSIFVSKSFGISDDCSQNAQHMTTAVAIVRSAVSTTLRDACKDVRATDPFSEI